MTSKINQLLEQIDTSFIAIPYNKKVRNTINTYKNNPKLIEECENTVTRLIELGWKDIDKLCEIIKLYQTVYLQFVDIVGEKQAEILTFEKFYNEKLKKKI
jgi:hypothetical protein|tara:strand:- start:130 stop:432 length:303 start_codon:yes stop_codon:yes gene_type:complete